MNKKYMLLLSLFVSMSCYGANNAQPELAHTISPAAQRLAQDDELLTEYLKILSQLMQARGQDPQQHSDLRKKSQDLLRRLNPENEANGSEGNQ